MPSNPHKEYMKAYKHVDKIIRASGKNNQVLDYNGLIRETVMLYPIGWQALDSFIKKGFVNTHLCTLESNNLVWNGGEHA